MITEITILSYFLFVLAIGFYSSFKIKKPGDYYVAGKKAGLFQVAGSLLATILGGSAILGTIEFSRQTGWPALWFLFCASLGLFVLLPMSKKISRYGKFTLPELLGTFYGKKAEIIASVVIPVAWVGVVAAQIIAAAKIIESLGIVSYPFAALIAGAVFILYTLAGGQFSILKTDLIQSVLIVAGLGAMFFFALNRPHSYEMTAADRILLFNKAFTLVDLIILMLTYSVTFVVGPDIYSRIFCAKNEQTAKSATLLVALLLIPVSFLLTYLGIYSVQYGNEGIVSFAQGLLPDWAYGLFIAALLSAVMSSADTTLLTSSMILAELSTGNLDKKTSMKITRIFLILIGTCGILIALYITSIIQALLFALTVFSGAFVVPVLAGLAGARALEKNVVFAIVAGGLTALAGKISAVFLNDV